MSDRVRLAIDGGVAEVRLNRPEKLNALDADMFTAIVEVLETLAAAPKVRAVVLSGEGRAFCAGLDMASMSAGGTGLRLDRRPYGPANIVQYVAWGWRTLRMPVIAAVHGVAFGGGLQIMSGADIRIGEPSARFSIREAYWGLIPNIAGTALWRTLVRDDVVRELTYTAREFLGTEAERYGFLTRLSTDPRVDALSLAKAIAERSPDAVRAAKRLYNCAADADAATLLQAESSEQLKLKGSPNQLEAVAAHAEGRAARFHD